MELNLQWSYFDPTGQQKFKWDKLNVSKDDAKIILKEAIRYWDLEESFSDVGKGFPNLLQNQIDVFGFDTTDPVEFLNNKSKFLNEMAYPNLFDIKINNVSISQKTEEKEDQLSDEYWENDDADGLDEPIIVDEDILDKFVEELLEN